jgi:hypothetical protein
MFVNEDKCYYLVNEDKEVTGEDQLRVPTCDTSDRGD